MNLDVLSREGGGDGIAPLGMLDALGLHAGQGEQVLRASLLFMGIGHGDDDRADPHHDGHERLAGKLVESVTATLALPTVGIETARSCGPAYDLRRSSYPARALFVSS